jgi:DNA-binding NarL/FixJ family response regulator
MTQRQPRAGETFQILVVDDHPIVRHGLRQIIDQEQDLAVCGEAEDASTALEKLESSSPDMAVVDLSLGESDGLVLIKEIQKRYSWMPILVVSMHDETLYAERVLRAGALGYVNKQEATEKMIPAIRSVLAGGIFVSEEVTERMLARRVKGDPIAGGSPLQLLSDRELQVFGLIGQGLTTRGIAERLGLSVKTIETYRAHIKSKLRLKHTTELLQHAFLWAHGTKDDDEASQ